MPSQLQQHHDNGVRDDITNPIMENTMSNIKNIHNNRQILCDPQSQQHHNESYSKTNFKDENMMIIEVDHKKINDNVKINKSNGHNNRIEGTIMDYKSNTFDNSHLINNQSSSENLSSLSRRKNSVLNIKSLLCESSANLSVYDSPSSSVDEDSSMDDVSSHLGDTESLGSPRPFHKNSSTPVTTPPRSPPTDQEKRLFNNGENNKNDTAFMNDHSPYFNNNSNDHQRHQQHHHNYQDSGRYMEQGRFQEDTPWKRSRTIINHDLVLPPIRSLENNNNDFGNNNEISNGQFVHNPSSSPDHGKINSPVDRHSSQKSRNQLEQLADITESLRTSSSNSSHTDSAIRLPSLAAHNRSFDNDHRNFQMQNSPSNSLTSPRRSSFDVVQTRFSPYTPSTIYAPQRLPSNIDQRCHSELSGFMPTTSRNDHENPYLHGHHNSSYGYDRDANRHYIQQRHTYGGLHSPSSPNTYSHHGYSVSSHSYPTPPSTHHHLQLSHHHHHLGPYLDPTNSGAMVKAKRKRANANQLKVLNQVFQHTFFPSTELRIQLGKQLGMSPRTVQIWFQNKRQSWRSKSRATNSPIKDDDGDSNLEVEVNNNNDDDVDENLVSRRSSNSNLSCSDDDEMGRRPIPDSPPSDNSYSRGDYFTRSQMDNNSNENVNMTSGGKIASTQNSYFAQQSQHSSNNNNGDYYHHRRTNSSGTLHPSPSGVMTPTSPSSSLTNQLPSPVYPSTSTNERLPTFASSFAHASSYHHAASPRLPMINHRSPQTQSYGYQSTVSSGI